MVAFAAFWEKKVFWVAIRSVQAVLAIIVLGLTGYVCNWWSGYWNATAPSSIGFLLFCSIASLLALAWLIVVPLKFAEHKVNNKIAHTVVEGVIMLFWFAGFIAAAVFLNDRVCFGHVCGAAKAATAFGAFAWVAFAITFALALGNPFAGRSFSSRRSEPQPAMTEGV